MHNMHKVMLRHRQAVTKDNAIFCQSHKTLTTHDQYHKDGKQRNCSLTQDNLTLN